MTLTPEQSVVAIFNQIRLSRPAHGMIVSDDVAALLTLAVVVQAAASQVSHAINQLNQPCPPQ